MENKKILIGAAFSAMLLVSCENGGDRKEQRMTNKAEVQGQCHGVNTCKGKGQCAGSKQACNGNNSCKGMGWVKMTANECKEKGGTFKSS